MLMSLVLLTGKFGIMATHMDDGKNSKTTLLEYLIAGPVFIAIYAAITFLIVKEILKTQVYTDTLFYFSVIATIAWWIFKIFIYYKLYSWRRIKMGISQAVFIILFIAGILISLLTGKRLWNNEGLMVYIYMFIPTSLCWLFLAVFISLDIFRSEYSIEYTRPFMNSFLHRDDFRIKENSSLRTIPMRPFLLTHQEAKQSHTRPF